MTHSYTSDHQPPQSGVFDLDPATHSGGQREQHYFCLPSCSCTTLAGNQVFPSTLNPKNPRSGRAEKTINYCSCMPRYNYTTPAGKLIMVEGGGCIRAAPQELPWCFVIAATCVAPPENQRRGQYWDTCLNSGARARPADPRAGTHL